MQFGRALERMLRLARHANPKFGPVKGSKHDMKDGYYKLFLKITDCLKLAVLLPKCENEDQLVAIPMALTMGWVQSPASHCTMSETICDLANQKIRDHKHESPKHRLSSAAEACDDNDPSSAPRPREPEDQEAAEALYQVPGVTRLSEAEPELPPPPSNRPLYRPV